MAEVSPAVRAVAVATKGFMPDGEGMALHRAGLAAAAAGLGPLVEIGTYCARSALYLGDAARCGGTVLFSVDHHRGSEELQPGWEHHDPDVVDAAGRIDTLPFARAAVAAAGLEDHVVLVVGKSAVVAAAWRGPLGLVFIDGGHAPEVAWADYRSWAPKVSHGGWLVIHDVFADPADGGQAPYELYREALACGDFVAEAGAGCGSLRVLRRR